MTRPRRDRYLLAVILVVAAALRVWRLGQGLPDFVEEAIPLRRALEMGGWQAGRLDLNPHFFNYPSLVIYLHLALIRLQIALGQLTGALAAPADFWLRLQVDPTAAVAIARLVGVAADLAACVGAWRLAERLRPGAGNVAAGIVALAGVMIRTSRLVHVDPMLAALLIWALERTVAWQDVGGRRRLGAAVVLIGLAAGAKYQGGLLVIPLALALRGRSGWRGLARWPLLAFASVGVFLLTTPYALLDLPAFRDGLFFESRHMAAGHLGTVGRTGLGFTTITLARDLGPVLLAAALVGLVLPWRRGGLAATVAAATVPLGVAIASARMEADRYLVPLIPLLAVSAAAVLSEWTTRRRLSRAMLAALALAAGGPVIWHGVRAAWTGGDHTQIQARRWIDDHVDRDNAVLVLEPYGPVLPNPFDEEIVRAHPAWQLASDAAREAYLAPSRTLAVVLPFLASGELRVQARNVVTGHVEEIVVFEHAADANALTYEPALLAGVDYFVASSGVGKRHRDDRARYPRQNALYDLLERHADPLARFSPGRGVDGPEITVYSLGQRFRDAALTPPRLDPFWWTRDIPLAARERFDRIAVQPEARCGTAPLCPDGRLAPWVRGMHDVFAGLALPLVGRLCSCSLELENWPVVQQLATPMVIMDPADLRGVDAYVQAATALGDAAGAERALRAGIRAAEAQPGNWLKLALAQLLRATQRETEAAAVLQEVVASAAADERMRRTATSLLREMTAP